MLRLGRRRAKDRRLGLGDGRRRGRTQRHLPGSHLADDLLRAGQRASGAYKSSWAATCSNTTRRDELPQRAAGQLEFDGQRDRNLDVFGQLRPADDRRVRPSGTARDVADKHRDIERIFRAEGNRQSRQRLNPDGTPRPDKPSAHHGHQHRGGSHAAPESADARTLPLRFVKEDEGRSVVGTIDPEILGRVPARCRRRAVDAAAMAAFVQWLGGRYEAVRDALPRRALEIRPKAHPPGDHGRTPDIVADLYAGAEVFIGFAVECGAITAEEAGEIRDEARSGLLEAAAEARRDDPAQVDAGGNVHRPDHGRPGQRPSLLGRHQGGRAAGHGSRLRMAQGAEVPGSVGLIPMWVTGPNAQRIGWTDGTIVSTLEPLLSYGVARAVAEKQGQAFPVTSETLHKLLFDGRKLALT